MGGPLVPAALVVAVMPHTLFMTLPLVIAYMAEPAQELDHCFACLKSDYAD